MNCSPTFFALFLVLFTLVMDTFALPLIDQRMDETFSDNSPLLRKDKTTPDRSPFKAFESRLIDGMALAAARHGHHANLYAKRACKYNLGISNDCEYRDAAQAALRRRFAKSKLSPGKRGSDTPIF
ncbi:hypothetical protein BV898_06610 [Hypsibius exemplaris]|uniref:Uncharacterized protein n=1 Tax=Hypsibius exemplaris TaxID=2072580 RepID=A0A1W0WVZ5_HYPEX|nr:hypothetical protein BV898_06610 [Hypsibius exemplaris]